MRSALGFLSDPADAGDPFGFEKKPKYMQSRKKIKWGIERSPLKPPAECIALPVLPITTSSSLASTGSLDRNYSIYTEYSIIYERVKYAID